MIRSISMFGHDDGEFLLWRMVWKWNSWSRLWCWVSRLWCGASRSTTTLTRKSMNSKTSVRRCPRRASNDSVFLWIRVAMFSCVQQTERTYERETGSSRTFCGCFIIDPQAFQDVFQAQMVCCMTTHEEEAMITIPQHLLSNQNTSRIFADILLKFLVKRIPDLSMNVSVVVEDDKKVTTNRRRLRRRNSWSRGKTPWNDNTLLRLFKLVFHSIVMFADSELVLRYLAVIVKTGIKSAMSAKRRIIFCFSWALFRRLQRFRAFVQRVCTSFTWYVPFSSLSLQHKRHLQHKHKQAHWKHFSITITSREPNHRICSWVVPLIPHHWALCFSICLCFNRDSCTSSG